VFTKQILTWKMAERRGDRSQYIDGMVDVVSLLRGSKEPTIVHTDYTEEKTISKVFSAA